MTYSYNAPGGYSGALMTQAQCYLESPHTKQLLSPLQSHAGPHGPSLFLQPAALLQQHFCTPAPGSPPKAEVEGLHRDPCHHLLRNKRPAAEGGGGGFPSPRMCPKETRLKDRCWDAKRALFSQKASCSGPSIAVVLQKKSRNVHEATGPAS